MLAKLQGKPQVGGKQPSSPQPLCSKLPELCQGEGQLSHPFWEASVQLQDWLGLWHLHPPPRELSSSTCGCSLYSGQDGYSAAGMLAAKSGAWQFACSHIAAARVR